ncbi:MAG TPA: hypothetical protein DEQ40_08805, partial [Oxalobacteraceae bacterium]|nr:hypothetical protein [Oxalobacteraceae bacterium]
MSAQSVSLLTHVIKRDGSDKPFDADKIRSALQRAGLATSEFEAEDAAYLA